MPARNTTIEMADFPGMILNSDAEDIPPGAGVIQVNLTSRRPGELSTRRGFRFAAFDSVTIIESLEADE